MRPAGRGSIDLDADVEVVPMCVFPQGWGGFGSTTSTPALARVSEWKG